MLRQLAEQMIGLAKALKIAAGMETTKQNLTVSEVAAFQLRCYDLNITSISFAAV